MKNSEVLTEARKIIQFPEHWTQGWYAKDAVSNNCSIDMGCQFCMLGAIKRVRHNQGGSTFTDVSFEHEPSLQYLINIVNPKFLMSDDRQDIIDEIASFNDNNSTTHEDVLEVYDRAIKLAEDAGD